MYIHCHACSNRIHRAIDDVHAIYIYIYMYSIDGIQMIYIYVYLFTFRLLFYAYFLTYSVYDPPCRASLIASRTRPSKTRSQARPRRRRSRSAGGVGIRHGAEAAGVTWRWQGMGGYGRMGSMMVLWVKWWLIVMVYAYLMGSHGSELIHDGIHEVKLVDEGCPAGLRWTETHRNMAFAVRPRFGGGDSLPRLLWANGAAELAVPSSIAWATLGWSQELSGARRTTRIGSFVPLFFRSDSWSLGLEQKLQTSADRCWELSRACDLATGEGSLKMSAMSPCPIPKATPWPVSPLKLQVVLMVDRKVAAEPLWEADPIPVQNPAVESFAVWIRQPV